MATVEVPATAGKSNSVWMDWQIKYVCTEVKQMSVLGFIEKLHSRCQFSPHIGLVIKLRLLFKFQQWNNLFCVFQR